MSTTFETRLRRVTSGSPKNVQTKRAKADIELLLRHGANSINALIGIAQDSSLKTDLRSASCWVLGQLRSPRGMPVLLDMVESAGPRIGWEAAKSLVLLMSSSKRGARRLNQVLYQGHGAHNRAAGAYVLGLTGNRSSIPLLIEVLHGPDAPLVRSRAAEALGNLGDVSTSEALISSLGDASPMVRLSAAYALGEVADETAIPFLKSLASAKSLRSSKTNPIKVEARRSIKRIRSRVI